MPLRRRTLLAAGAALPVAAGLGALPHPVPAAARDGSGPAGAGPLTNLAHLDFLGATVRPALLSGHDTWRLTEEPDLGTLWTYADRQPDGGYRRIGGGTYDPATGHYGQGAFNADDTARAAVVYLRHWRQAGAPTSRRAAYQLLRGLTYLQTSAGPNAGNVVLWMQSDGTLNPSAEPAELPDPSDSGPSYWLARTVWALGEGYAAFRQADPGFAGFLRARLDLAVAAVDRQVLSRYGQWDVADGRRVPGWLITGGADASSEAVLGLARYVEAGGGHRARTALARLAEGIAAMSTGGPDQWPYGGVLPTITSRSIWHAWGAQMPTALAVAASALGRPALLDTAVADVAGLTPELLTAGGCDNGWLPTPVDRTQIAYGVDARLRSLLTVAAATRRVGLSRLAALTAAWYFGANAAGTAMYDPTTGRTFDGVGGDGRVNRNSGAESTIQGLLSMLALDAEPRVARLARALTGVTGRDGLRVLEAETGALAGPATVVRPASAWTGESQYSAGAYVDLGDGGTISWTLPGGDQPWLVSPVVDLVPDRAAGRTAWRAGDADLGRIDHGAGGPQGVTAVPGALLPVALAAPVPAGRSLSARAERVGPAPLRVDALLVRPAVARVALAGADTGAVLLRNGTGTDRRVTASVPGAGVALVERYDRAARARGEHRVGGPAVEVVVPAYGFALVTRAG
jgi:hypothetical protein